MPALKDETGKKYGRLTVISRAENKGRAVQWLCRCDCGTQVAIQAGHLQGGHTKSCGCLQRDRRRESHTKHGMCGHPLYGIWSHMVGRTTNPNDPDWKDYGGRGIAVIDSWRHDAGAFITWALGHGWRPGLSIDRENNNLGYSPENCRFTTSRVQAGNTRRSQRRNFPIGVYRTEGGKKFEAKIYGGGRQIHLGRFTSASAAAAAYEAARRELEANTLATAA